MQFVGGAAAFGSPLGVPIGGKRAADGAPTGEPAAKRATTPTPAAGKKEKEDVEDELDILKASCSLPWASSLRVRHGWGENCQHSPCVTRAIADADVNPSSCVEHS